MTRSHQPSFATSALRALLALVAWSIPASRPTGHPAAIEAAPLNKALSEPQREGRDQLTLRIVTLPAIVYTDAVVRLEVETNRDPRSRSRVHWRTDAGILLFDDLARTSWKTPSTEGSYVVRVGVTVATNGTIGRSSEETLYEKRSIEVRRPSTEGMISIDEGSFIRGDVRGTRDTKEVKTIQNSSDEPFHEVALGAYWIDRYPVTNAAYVEYLADALKQGMVRVTPRSVMGHFEGEWVPFYYFESYEDLVWEYLDTVNARVPGFLHLISWDADRGRFSIQGGHEKAPVVDVSWFGAAAYARFHGKSLPSEAQWEKAARRSDTRRYPWGDHLPTAYHANLNHYRGKAPAPVGSFSPEGDSPYGVGDLVAGLFEWTGDWFNATYYQDHRADTALRSPSGPFWGKAHSIRSFPTAILQISGSLDDPAPVSSRYHWRFEFFVRDIFANRTTTFRTVIRPPETGYEYHDGF